MTGHRQIITGPLVYLEDGPQRLAVVIHEGKIEAIIDPSQMGQYADLQIIELPNSYHLIPGMIDMHIHGMLGVDVMDATPQALQTMVENLPKEGVTGFLATTMTMATQDIEKAIANVATFSQKINQPGAQILGLHLEGPFISPEKLGAHRREFVLEPGIDLFNQWQVLANDLIKLVTIAPEVSGAMAFIEYLTKQGVIASIGHSNASYTQTQQAIENGCCHVTHIFNAMSGLHHREPGVALAALMSSALIELIADGIHVCPAMMKFILSVKTLDQLCLVTDAMRAKCMPDGEYDLGGQTVTVANDSARLSGGTLAGSILTMQKALKNLVTLNLCSLSDITHFTAINPAKQLGIFGHKGSIAIGKDADLVVLDEQYNIHQTFCLGKVSFQSG
jgi:N-acetylglucosamine-6-phosphate deacetylase